MSYYCICSHWKIGLTRFFSPGQKTCKLIGHICILNNKKCNINMFQTLLKRHRLFSSLTLTYYPDTGLQYFEKKVGLTKFFTIMNLWDKGWRMLNVCTAFSVNSVNNNGVNHIAKQIKNYLLSLYCNVSYKYWC